MKWACIRKTTTYLAFVCVLAGFLQGAAPQLMASRTAQAQESEPQFNRVYITDVGNGGFVVSWTTSEASTGAVEWGEATPPTNWISDPAVDTSAHYVRVAEGDVLESETQHLFQVTSDTTVDDRNGDYHTVSTGPIPDSGTPSGRTIWGYVYQEDGFTPAAYVTVYLQIKDSDGLGSSGVSQWVTARTNEQGIWYYTMDIRTADAGGYFSFSDGADELYVIVRGGSAGVAAVATNTPADYPSGAYRFADIVLGSPSAPVTPSVSINQDSSPDVQLSWSHPADCADYEIWWSESPYFDRGDSGSHWLADSSPPLEGTTVGYTHVGALGDTMNEYYVIICFNLAGGPATGSSPTGSFSFSLKPGSS